MTCWIRGAAWQALAIGALLAPAVCAQSQAVNRSAAFPAELVDWEPLPANPVFTAQEAGEWAVKIRERGWILREDGCYHLWFSGYDGTREGAKRLGYATSSDGLRWTPCARNPLGGEHWIEDMMVVRHGGVHYMFAEGGDRNHAVMLTSTDRAQWKREGPLDVRLADGRRRVEEPCGTPTVVCAKGIWYLFYERLDRGVWLATAKDLRSRVWINVRDTPVLEPGPAEYDQQLIAIDQVIEHRGAFFAYYHASGDGRTWNTNVARSLDLVHWEKYPGNPIVEDNKSSGIVVPDGCGFRLYTMHDRIDVFVPQK